VTPPNKLFHEYLRCRQMSSLHPLPSKNTFHSSHTHISTDSYGFSAPFSCQYEFDEDLRICWKATANGSYASSTIEYDYGLNQFYDGVRNGIENCSLRCRSTEKHAHSCLGTLQRFCQENGSWALTVSPDLQCRTCFSDGRPVKVR
jgi:hypothetical protein